MASTSIGSTGVTFPDATTQATAINSVNAKTATSGAIQSVLIPATEQTASTTAVVFSSIPSWVNRVTLMVSGLSSNGTSGFAAVLGYGGGTTYQTSSYVSQAVYIYANPTTSTSTTQFLLSGTSFAAYTYSGQYIFSRLSGNTWTVYGMIANNAADYSNIAAGSVTLSGTLDKIKIATTNAVDTFDAGSINIMYE